MIQISDEAFAQMITEAMEKLPAHHLKAVKNVAVVYEDVPTEVQRAELKLQCNETLFGLYEGVPLTRRGGHTNYPPDKITIFKLPMLESVRSLGELKERIRHTVWHEVAHYFGLNHDQIHRLE